MLLHRLTVTVAVLAMLCKGFSPASVGANVQTYDGASGRASWTPGTAMPFVRFYLATVVGPDGRIYAIGGESHGGKATRTVQAYDVRTGIWTRCAPMPFASAGPIAATVGGKIYVIGAGGKVQVYDPGRNVWRIAGSLPAGVTASAAVAGPGSTIYVIGSSDPTDLEVFDTRGNVWTRRAKKPRDQHGGAVASGPDGRLYDAGGATYRLNSVVSIEVYDPGTNRWSYRAQIPTPRYGAAAATGPDGRVYVLGGLVAGSPVGTMEAYDPRKNRRVIEPAMPSPRQDLAAVWGPDGKLYAVGGAIARSQPSVEVYTP